MSKPKKKTSRSGRDGPEVHRRPTQNETIHESDATFSLFPEAAFSDPFFQQPNPFTIKTSSPARYTQSASGAGAGSTGGTGAGGSAPNVSHGTGPMGPTFCQADYNINAPNLKGVTNYIHAKNVMIGSNNNMNVHYNGFSGGGAGFQDGDSDEESSSDDASTTLKEEMEKKRKQEERYEKKAMFQETLCSSRPISDQEMHDVSKCLLGAWRKFLRYLDIEDEVLDKYYQDYMGSGGLAEVVYQSLDYWRRNTDSPEVQKVANALGRVNMWDTVSDHLHP